MSVFHITNGDKSQLSEEYLGEAQILKQKYQGLGFGTFRFDQLGAHELIVNGCQTTVTVREAYEKNQLRNDTRILLRIYATDNPNLVERITLTTNNQNKITDRDLRANDPVQRDIEHIMLDKFDHYYERKKQAI